jgi:lysophospholipase L1-like esterase
MPTRPPRSPEKAPESTSRQRRYWWRAGIVTVVGLASVVAVAATAPGSAARHKPLEAPAPAGSVAPAWEPQVRSLAGAGPWVLAGERASLNLPHTHPRVLFVGDSITEWWQRFGTAAWRADFAPLGAVDDGVAGDTTSNVLARLESGSLRGIHPQVVVLLIGTNNIPLGQSAADIARGVFAVVAVLHQHLPGARLILLALLPRDNPGSLYRRDVEAVNRRLAAGAPRAGVVYLNLDPRLLEPDGNFIPGVVHRDLLHPAAPGYARLAAGLAPVVRRLIGAGPAT